MHERIKMLFDELKLSKRIRNQQDFVERVGSDKATISNIIRGKMPPTNKVLAGIAQAFPEVNVEWLRTGEGQMLNMSEDLVNMNLLDTSKRPLKIRMVPLISLDAMGGFGSNVEQGEEYKEKLIPWENARDGDFAVMISGSSMMPVIMPGSYVLLRKVEGWREFIEYNILYVLELNDERRLLKLVQKSETPGCLTLISYNPNNPPQDIKTSFIEKVFKVISIKTDFNF